MARSVKLNNANEWTVVSTAAATTGRRGVAAVEAIPRDFLASGVIVDRVMDVMPVATRRAAGLPMVDLSVVPESDETYALAIRHPSGALTFHGPELDVTQRRGGSAAPVGFRFRVTLRGGRTAGGRRGIAAAVIKLVLLKVANKVADALLPALAANAEAALWERAGLSEGWFKLDADSLRSGELKPGMPETPGRALLLLHGTFSNVSSSFKKLADTEFLAQAKQLYGDETYAFNHFTISKTPGQNAQELLAGLSNREFLFDVIAYSRGGLVLRNLVERRSQMGAAAGRFKLRHGVLVASPNDGTPLATPERWEATVSWFANLLELFPDNPLTFGAGFVADAIVWIAQRAAGGLPGIASMDSSGEIIADLQGPPLPPATAYSALVANFTPTGNILERMVDVGVDAFFGSANDLVVPTAGGWLIDHADGPPSIPAGRIGCFGAGGNFPLSGPPVHHLNFFDRPEALRFLVEALNEVPHELSQIHLPSRFANGQSRRGAVETIPAVRLPALSTAPASAPAGSGVPSVVADHSVFSDALQLMILAPRSGAEQPIDGAKRSRRSRADSDGAPQPYQLLATYGGARIIEPFAARGGEAGQRWREIIAMHERMKKYVDGAIGSEAPTDEELIKYGALLFDTLFPREVRRLYDVARSRERAGHLNVIFTSMIPWIADKPWEFAFDPDRKTFLATQELHFVRNALTAMPVEVVSPKIGPLRILVAVAQPIGTATLSAEQEESVIRRGFQPLIEEGLVELDVLRATTPTALHRWLSYTSYDVVHFIGHGAFDVEAGNGYLVFEDENGAMFNVSVRNACEILCQRGIRLVFLNACETGRGDIMGTAKRKADFNRGIAPALVAHGVPAVVANQFSVRDEAATEFSQHFYWALAQGATFGSAAREARIAVNYSTTHDTIDWAVPVVYARDPEGRICVPRKPTLDSMRTPLVASSARRATDRHEFRIAVWDVNHVFPDLENTVQRMNTAQTRFGFEVVDISVPLGAWQKTKKDGLQLNANRAARGLNNKRLELGVDFLFCIIDKLITYEEDGRVYTGYNCWWSSPGQENIIIFAAAYRNQPTQGPGADHLIGNAVVQGLTGIRADAGTHARKAKHCPLYWNGERDMNLDIGPQRFDKICEARLRKKIPDDLKALKDLLSAFD